MPVASPLDHYALQSAEVSIAVGAYCCAFRLASAS